MDATGVLKPALKSSSARGGLVSKIRNIEGDLDNSTSNVLIPLDSWKSGLTGGCDNASRVLVCDWPQLRLVSVHVNVVIRCGKGYDESEKATKMESYLKALGGKQCVYSLSGVSSMRPITSSPPSVVCGAVDRRAKIECL
ncbi:hypothetical protein Tco_1090389 [Tanacetum coccineum]|uniref:Uncharacterized protein n=1 Tax=Tanacetum coccineum TaxID=301880 RepID=A0ABQ5I568_9ASTR